MGKHSANRSATAPSAAPSRSTAQRTSDVRAPRAHRPTPLDLVLTAGFGALAVVVAVIALLWAGVGASVAFAVGAGLLAIGAIGFLVVRSTGLLARGEPGAADVQPPSVGTHP